MTVWSLNTPVFWRMVYGFLIFSHFIWEAVIAPNLVRFFAYDLWFSKFYLTGP